MGLSHLWNITFELVLLEFFGDPIAIFDLPRDHEFHSRLKSTRIPKYIVEPSVSLTCATTRLNLYFFNSFEIQS
ncbi:uncharacterized protein G2W53_010407 [Senna tora]|uniref:Uncharacterized protein n=1 Tax=Senna tora TaxID=362788 RepID=A0A834WZY1_9FABA|nr:uncharacterized protein G2W53_010407 [Senna tora]